MKSRFFAAVVLLFAAFAARPALACTIEITPLRREYRKAEAAFVGRVAGVADGYAPTPAELAAIPEDWRETARQMKGPLFSKVTFEIAGQWKGGLPATKEFVAVAYWSCGCSAPALDRFETGREYLVLTRSKNFLTICDARPADTDRARADRRRLDRFWFRAWASVYPF